MNVKLEYAERLAGAANAYEETMRHGRDAPRRVRPFGRRMRPLREKNPAATERGSATVFLGIKDPLVRHGCARVIPAKAGIQNINRYFFQMDSRFRGNDARTSILNMPILDTSL